MVRRWLIRSLFLLPLLCVVAVWVASYFGELAVLGFTPKGFFRAEAIQGHLNFHEGNLPWVEYKGFHITYEFYRGLKLDFEMLAVGAVIERRGFYVGQMPGVPSSLLIIFPLWLPTLLLLALNWFVWRKTKPKKIGGAFPIEPTEKPK